MIKKEEVISFVWQHILLLISLYVMTFGVAACVRSQLGSSVISTIPYVMASAGTMLDYIPRWTIGARFRNCHGGEVRLSNHAWRGHFHRHSQGYRLAFP